jgi:hypothetical protein
MVDKMANNCMLENGDIKRPHTWLAKYGPEGYHAFHEIDIDEGEIDWEIFLEYFRSRKQMMQGMLADQRRRGEERLKAD